MRTGMGTGERGKGVAPFGPTNRIWQGETAGPGSAHAGRAGESTAAQSDSSSVALILSCIELEKLLMNEALQVNTPSLNEAE